MTKPLFICFLALLCRCSALPKAPEDSNEQGLSNELDEFPASFSRSDFSSSGPSDRLVHSVEMSSSTQTSVKGSSTLMNSSTINGTEQVNASQTSDGASNATSNTSSVGTNTLAANANLLRVTPDATASISSNTSQTPSNKSQAEENEKVTTPTKEPSAVFYNAAFQRTLAWLSDTYTLSILIPVCAGFVFAAFIIVTIAFCRCVRRRCCRRRLLRRKVLPESVKNMRPSDRARLLAESSDEEF